MLDFTETCVLYFKSFRKYVIYVKTRMPPVLCLFYIYENMYAKRCLFLKKARLRRLNGPT